MGALFELDLRDSAREADLRVVAVAFRGGGVRRRLLARRRHLDDEATLLLDDVHATRARRYSCPINPFDVEDTNLI